MILSVLIASIAVYSWKLLGYLIPERFITDKFRDFAERVTVSLLAAMVMIQGFTVTGEVVVDARLPALLVAALMLWMRAPYILVVIGGAAVAAGLRMLGL
jgi:branched-subunit amino acid transport protein